MMQAEKTYHTVVSFPGNASRIAGSHLSSCAVLRKTPPTKAWTPEILTLSIPMPEEININKTSIFSEQHCKLNRGQQGGGSVAAILLLHRLLGSALLCVKCRVTAALQASRRSFVTPVRLFLAPMKTRRKPKKVSIWPRLITPKCSSASQRRNVCRLKDASHFVCCRASFASREPIH